MYPNAAQKKLTVNKWMQGHHREGHHAHIPSSSSCEKNMEKNIINLLNYKSHMMSKLSENWIQYENGLLIDEKIYYIKSAPVVFNSLA